MVDFRDMSGTRLRKRLAAFALVTIAVLAVTLTATASTQAPTAPSQSHPRIEAGQRCSSIGCHAATRRHKAPYDVKADCSTCHRTQTWRFVTYSHKDPDLDQGIHQVMGCERCHTEGSPVLPKTCTDCHEPKHGGWTKCRSCHIPSTWRDRKATPQGHLSLTGGHANVGCLDCHTMAQEPAVPRTCVDCHGVHHGGLRDCASCHDPANGWKPGAFDHSAFFRITGRHTRLACTKCHPRGQFAGTSPACVSCHGRQHGGLTACSKCHTTSRFRPSTFRHSRVFPLSGGPHASLACSRCHPGDRYAKVAGRSCAGCHGSVHGVSTCTPCHRPNGAVSAGFDHSVFFRLLGAHTRLACTRCHTSGFTAPPGRDCVDCHGVHHGDRTRCVDCHSTSAWSPIQPVSHPSPVTLGSAHASRPCTLCHPTLVFSAPTKPCQDCHAADVPHVGPARCYDCHRPTAWADVRFSHPPVPGGHEFTDFPCLDGCHQGDFTRYTCTRCH